MTKGNRPKARNYQKQPNVKKLATEESRIVKRFIIVLLIVVVSVTGIYFLTRIFVSKDLFAKNTTTTAETTFNYEITILGSTFNRPYDEYYVIAYKSSDEKASSLSATINKYLDKDDHIKIYYADLDSYFNKSFYDKDNVNPNAKEASELKVGDYTLIKIKDKAIEKYIDDFDDITSELE